MALEFCSDSNCIHKTLGIDGTETFGVIGERNAVTFGHPSGTQRVGTEAKLVNGQWTATKVVMSRSARILMEGWARVPGDSF